MSVNGFRLHDYTPGNSDLLWLLYCQGCNYCLHLQRFSVLDNLGLVTQMIIGFHLYQDVVGLSTPFKGTGPDIATQENPVNHF